jgi:tellurite methyltransferase
MPRSPSEWNARHRAAAEETYTEPATIFSELLPLLPRGIALDLACGPGRNTFLLAARQQRVVGVDYSPVALSDLEKRARLRRVEVQRSASLEIPATIAKHGIHLVEADLEQAILPKDSFSLILCIHYLQRSLFPQIASALRPGGVLLFETYTHAQLEFPGGPKNPSYLLDEGELRSAFPSLHLIFYRELRAGKGIASLLAQRPPS